MRDEGCVSEVKKFFTDAPTPDSHRRANGHDNVVRLLERVKNTSSILILMTADCHVTSCKNETCLRREQY